MLGKRLVRKVSQFGLELGQAGQPGFGLGQAVGWSWLRWDDGVMAGVLCTDVQAEVALASLASAWLGLGRTFRLF